MKSKKLIQKRDSVFELIESIFKSFIYFLSIICGIIAVILTSPFIISFLICTPFIATIVWFFSKLSYKESFRTETGTLATVVVSVVSVCFIITILEKTFEIDIITFQRFGYWLIALLISIAIFYLPRNFEENKKKEIEAL